MSWATLVTAASADTATRARLLVDLLDTPDTVGLSWDAANGLPGASEFAETAAHALMSMHVCLLEANEFAKTTTQALRIPYV